MSIVITRLFDDYEHARQAVSDLEAGGIAHDNVSIVANNSDGRLGSADPATTGTASGGATAPSQCMAERATRSSVWPRARASSGRHTSALSARAAAITACSAALPVVSAASATK